MPHYPAEIEYSDKYNDDSYEYRHVILTKAVTEEMYKVTQWKRLMSEDEWRGVGISPSRGLGALRDPPPKAEHPPLPPPFGHGSALPHGFVLF